MKKIKKPEHRVGIWIDEKKAILIHIDGDAEPIVEKIRSGVETRVRYAGETKVFARFGNAFISDQEKKQHRQKNQREVYFKKIISHLPKADSLYIFGPSDARHELINDLEKDPVLRSKFIQTAAADRMTDKQAVKHALDYFESEDFKTEKKKLRKMLATH